jgi:hypothetical protein
MFDAVFNHLSAQGLVPPFSPGSAHDAFFVTVEGDLTFPSSGSRAAVAH